MLLVYRHMCQGLLIYQGELKSRFWEDSHFICLEMPPKKQTKSTPLAPPQEGPVPYNTQTRAGRPRPPGPLHGGKPLGCHSTHSSQKKKTQHLQAGRLAGPFLSPPISNLRASPLGVVPKKTQREYWLIHHLSYPHHPGH